MKVKCIRILPGDSGWVASVEHLPGDRVAQPILSNQGFYYCPESESNQKAFSILKKEILASHKTEISKLQKSMNKLKLLKSPKKEA